MNALASTIEPPVLRTQSLTDYLLLSRINPESREDKAKAELLKNMTEKDKTENGFRHSELMKQYNSRLDTAVAAGNLATALQIASEVAYYSHMSEEDKKDFKDAIRDDVQKVRTQLAAQAQPAAPAVTP